MTEVTTYLHFRVRKPTERSTRSKTLCALRSRRLSRLDVLVEAEEVRWIILCFQCRESLVLLTISRADAFVGDFSEIIHVGGIGEEWLHRLHEFTGPENVGLRFLRIRPHGCDHQVEGPITMPERSGICWNTLEGSIAVVLNDNHRAGRRSL